MTDLSYLAMIPGGIAFIALVILIRRTPPSPMLFWPAMAVIALSFMAHGYLSGLAD